MKENQLNFNENFLKEQVLESLKNNPSLFNSKDILNNINANDFNGLNKIVSEVINTIMKSERDIYLENNPTDTGNGFYDRTLNTKSDKIDISVPRTRINEFRPTILPDKYKRYIDDYKEFVCNLIISGNSKSQIKSILDANGQDYSVDAINKIYEDLNERMEYFKTRELPSEIAFIYIDGYCLDVKENNKVKKAVLYIFLGVGFDGSKQILGFYHMFGSESAEKWKEIFNDLINRGLKKVLLFICDNLTGLKNTICALFPKSDVQLCLIHLMRNAKRNMSRDDASELIDNLKAVKESKSSFDDDYYKKKITDFISYKKKKYSDFLSKLETDLDNYLTFLKYPEKIRKHIYSTNQMESINNQIEKIRVRQEGYFQSINNLELNMFILSNRLLIKWAKRNNPFFAHCAYEIRQLFNLKFFPMDEKLDYKEAA